MSSRRKNRRPSLKGSLNPSKRHRDRVNVELDNLAKLLPFPPDVITKLDKLSVLRLSASYLRTKNFFKGNISTKTSSSSSTDADEIEKNGLLSEMMLEALDGFLMVLTQDGEIFYASETINEFLGVSQASVIHQDFLRFVHVDDQKMLLNKLQLVPSPPEQKIREISDNDEIASDQKEDESPDEDFNSKERSFVCRFKCILNTNAGFFKPFQCHGRLRKMENVETDGSQYGLFLMCSPVEVSTSILEIRMKSMLFCTKNNLDLSFVDIDQKGKQIVGYSKKDVLARSSYCMMHYDDIPILKRMHQELLATGKCHGVFRWLNKHLKWQWLNGSGQVILKNNQPDFVLTTNKPLTDEEGEEELRRRERDHGIVPTSPSNMLSHLQISGSPPPLRPSGPTGNLNQSLPDFSGLGSTGGVSTTSCTSHSFTPDDLPWDSATDSLFEANKVSWDSNASLAELDEIGKGDLVGGLLHLDVNDLTFDSNLENAAPTGSTTATQDYSPTFSQHASLLMTSSQPPRPPPPMYPSNQQPSPVHSAGLQQNTPPYRYTPNLHQPPPVPRSRPPNPNVMVSPTISPVGYSPDCLSPGNTYSPSNVPTKIMSPPSRPENGKTSSCTYGSQQGGVVKSSNPMGMRWSTQPPSGPSSYSVATTIAIPPSQDSLLRVDTNQPLRHPYIKTESGRTNVGYYCNTPSGDQQGLSGISRIPGMISNHQVSAPSPQVTNTTRYQNRQLSHAGFPPCVPAPPSPYSSACSSSSSYTDGLHVQFSPTEIQASPFPSPRNDEYHHGNVGMSGPVHGQYYPSNGNGRMVPRPPNRLQNSIPQSFVNVAEISPVGMVEELVSGLHHAPPVPARNSGMANW